MQRHWRGRGSGWNQTAEGVATERGACGGVRGVEGESATERGGAACAGREVAEEEKGHLSRPMSRSYG